MSLLVDIRARAGAFELAVAFETAETGVTALFGPSGAGKSLTLAAVAGALKPDAGRIVADGEVLFDRAGRIDRPMERRAVGWAFQDGRLFPHLDVEANLRYGLKRARGRPARVGFDEVVETLDIRPLLRRRTRDLSGGERQRVGIGRALLSQPRLLLMDEPLSALDAARKAEVLPFLERLKGLGLPVLYVTHSLSEVLRLADRLVLLEAGRTVAQGPAAELVSRPDLPMLAARADTAAALDAVVTAHDERRGLSRLDAMGASLLTPLIARPVGAKVRAVVLARDVLLATTQPAGLSARNVLPGRIESLTARADGAVLARVALGDGPRILSAITRDAVEALGLAEGAAVWAIVKSVAVEGATGGLLAARDD
jgi:molybdate transport system ATP-binding protein